MKKLIFLWMFIFSFAYGELSEYSSRFGLGAGLGFPTGYEFKGVYRQNEWLSLSLNYNILEIKNISQKVGGNPGDDTDIDVTGNFKFSTPGVMLHYHPFGGNMRLSAGFLYDMGGLDINANGTMTIQSIVAPVTGDISIKFGKTYPYLGIAYGYDVNSVVHLELSLGAYMLKRPEVDLFFNIGTDAVITDILDDPALGLTPAQITQIKDLLASSGGNILDLPQILADVIEIPPSIAMPDANELEGDLVSVIQEGYNYLPSFLGYNLLPVISIGFTVFPF